MASASSWPSKVRPVRGLVCLAFRFEARRQNPGHSKWVTASFLLHPAHSIPRHLLLRFALHRLKPETLGGITGQALATSGCGAASHCISASGAKVDVTFESREEAALGGLLRPEGWSAQLSAPVLHGAKVGHLMAALLSVPCPPALRPPACCAAPLRAACPLPQLPVWVPYVAQKHPSI